MVEFERLNKILDERGEVLCERNKPLLTAARDCIDKLVGMESELEAVTRLSRRLFNMTGDVVPVMVNKGNFNCPYIMVRPDGIYIATGGMAWEEDPVMYDYTHQSFIIGNTQKISLDSIRSILVIGILEIPVFMRESRNTYRDVANAIIQIVEDWPRLEAALTAEIEKMGA